MNLARIVNFSALSCGLVGILMVMMATLAYLKGQHKIGNRMGIAIIVLVLLGIMVALSVSEF